MNDSHGRRPTPLAQLRAEAVSTRRLARFYADETRATDSTPLAAAAALVYIRAERIEADAKELAA